MTRAVETRQRYIYGTPLDSRDADLLRAEAESLRYRLAQTQVLLDGGHITDPALVGCDCLPHRVARTLGVAP